MASFKIKASLILCLFLSPTVTFSYSCIVWRTSHSAPITQTIDQCSANCKTHCTTDFQNNYNGVDCQTTTGGNIPANTRATCSCCTSW